MIHHPQAEDVLKAFFLSYVNELIIP